MALGHGDDAGIGVDLDPVAGLAAGFIPEGHGYYRTGFRFDPDPAPARTMPFFEEIGHDNSVECWCDELQIFHNPNARNPLPEGAEASGAIQRRAVILDPTIMGFGITVFAYVRLKAHDEATLEAPERAACDRAEIVDCFSMSGDFDYSFRIVVQSIDDYERFLKKALLHLPGISSVNSHFAVKCIKKTTKLPI